MDILSIATTIAIPSGLAIIAYFIKRLIDKIDSIDERFQKHTIDDARIANIVEARYQEHDALKESADKLESRIKVLEDKTSHQDVMQEKMNGRIDTVIEILERVEKKLESMS